MSSFGYVVVVTHKPVLNDARYMWVVYRTRWSWLATIEAWFWNHSGTDLVAFVESI